VKNQRLASPNRKDIPIGYKSPEHMYKTMRKKLATSPSNIRKRSKMASQHILSNFSRKGDNKKAKKRVGTEKSTKI